LGVKHTTNLINTAPIYHPKISSTNYFWVFLLISAKDLISFVRDPQSPPTAESNRSSATNSDQLQSKQALHPESLNNGSEMQTYEPKNNKLIE
jgi:hypothetical protein